MYPASAEGTSVKSMRTTTIPPRSTRPGFNIMAVMEHRGQEPLTLIRDQLVMIDTLITCMAPQLKKYHPMGTMENYR